jgi:hypothetical protein
MPTGWKSRLALYAAALWWGSLTAIGFIAVPLVFANSASAAQAGLVTAKLFTGQTWTSIGCGVLLLMSSRANDEPPMEWARGAIGFVLGGLLLALLGEFAIAPKIIARENLPLWHSVGSAMYLLQWACAGVTLWKL